MEIEKREEKNNSFTQILKGVIISLISTFILLSIFAIILTFTNVSENTINPVIIIISSLSILFGSSIANSKIKKQGLINGGIIGLIYIVILYFVSSFFYCKFSLNLDSIIMIAIGIIFGIIGGIIGVNKV